MAAIQVYKTDTFETQRLKINQIGQLVSNFSGGGNDFAAGNLKLGDGTIASPSLSFTSNSTLGFYKSLPSRFGIVSENKKVVDFSDEGSFFYKNLNVTQNSLFNAQIRIDSNGTLYDPGTYTFIDIDGGTGSKATAEITVDPFSGVLNSSGSNYFPGNFTNIPLVGGSGSGTVVSFDVDGIEGDIVGGSGYTFGAYENVVLQGGSGNGLIADILTTQSGEVSLLDFKSRGSGYQNGDVLTADTADLGGTGGGFTFTITSNPYQLNNFQITNKGSGYSVGNILSFRTAVTETVTLDSNSSTLTLPDVSTIQFGDLVEVISGTGELRPVTIVNSVDSGANTVTLSKLPLTSGSATITFYPEYGNPSPNLEYEITNVGGITNFTIDGGGSGYIAGDILTLDGEDLVQVRNYDVQVYDVSVLTFSSPLAANYFSPGDGVIYGEETATVYKVNTSGGSLVSIVVDDLGIIAEDIVTKALVESAPDLTVASATPYQAYFIDLGTSTPNLVITPDLTFAPGNIYRFNFLDDSNTGHVFAFSKFAGGIWGSSRIEGLTATLDVLSTSITLSDTTNILEGMLVEVTDGQGQLITNTLVVSVDSSTEITISKNPLASGSATLRFTGTEYTSNITRNEDSITIKVTDSTPDLYYYCKNHPNMGGLSGDEALITNDIANARVVFGSGFQATVAEITSSNIIEANPDNGYITTLGLISQTSNIGNATSSSLSSSAITTNSLVVQTMSSPADEDIGLSTTNFNVNANILVGNNAVNISRATGNITTTGVIKTTDSLIVDDITTIDANTISTATGNNLVLDPADLRVAKVDATTALVVPVGTTAQRPQIGVRETGAIRYNTTTQQYEGFSDYSGTAAWSSLGGIRDVDGNTYILAEETTGANDNTFYFYNNGQNTLRLTTQYLDFRSTKKIRSENMSAPAYTDWTPNAFASQGDYIRYKTNIYQVISVTGSGQLAGSANPPIHDVGAELNNEVNLLWYTSAVDSITFEEVASIQIDPNGTAPLVINNELFLESSVIRSLVNDIIISPADGKKLEIDAESSLVIPVGTTDQRGSPAIGSIRFNTDIQTYEGYIGNNKWGSLGGVKDVDGNTYILPETAPGANENILYFYNDGNNTLQLSSSGLDFYSTDNITSSQSNVLNINVQTVSFNSSEFTIDNSGTSTVLTSSKETIDFNMSTGLTTEKLISFTDEGDIVINNTYSEGSISNITVLDYRLKDFELSDLKTSTDDLALVRGTIDSRSTIVYDPSIHVSGKLSVIVENVTKNERELIEFNVCHKGSDIFYTEYGNISTNGELISTLFDFTASNEVRATFSLNTINNDSGDTVNIVAIKTLIKK